MGEFEFNNIYVRIPRKQRETLEAKLPEGFRHSGGRSKCCNEDFQEVSYHFLPVLTKEQIIEVTKTLYEIGSDYWHFRAKKSNN